MKDYQNMIISRIITGNIMAKKGSTPVKSNAITFEVHSREQIAADIDALLTAYLAAKAHEAGMIHPRYAQLIREMQSLMTAGGKRMRPYLTVSTYEAYGGTNYRAICQVAAAKEMIHFAMLVHDDIIDNDYTRYGTDNVSGRYLKEYQPRTNDESVASHAASSSALLAGDAAISFAYDLISESGFDARLVVRAQKQLSQSIFTVVGGELIDSDSPLYPQIDTDPLVVARHKTSYYSFVGPLMTGAIMANAPEEDLIKLECFGTALGIGFQLADDLLGIFGDEAVTGKSVLSDIREGKRTLLYQLAHEHANDTQKRVLERLYGKHDLTKTEAAQVREAIKSSGAYELCIEKIDAYAASSIEVIRMLGISDSAKQQLETIVTKATKREY